MKWKVKKELNLDENDLKDLKGIENCISIHENLDICKNPLKSIEGLEKVKFTKNTVLHPFLYYSTNNKVLINKLKKLFNNKEFSEHGGWSTINNI